MWFWGVTQAVWSVCFSYNQILGWLFICSWNKNLHTSENHVLCSTFFLTFLGCIFFLSCPLFFSGFHDASGSSGIFQGLGHLTLAASCVLRQFSAQVFWWSGLDYSCSASSVEIVANMGMMGGNQPFLHFTDILELHCVGILDVEMLALWWV